MYSLKVTRKVEPQSLVLKLYIPQTKVSLVTHFYLHQNCYEISERCDSQEQCFWQILSQPGALFFTPKCCVNLTQQYSFWEAQAYISNARSNVNGIELDVQRSYHKCWFLTRCAAIALARTAGWVSFCRHSISLIIVCCYRLLECVILNHITVESIRIMDQVGF